MFEDFIDDITNRFRTFQLPPEIRQSFESFLSKMGASTRKTVTVSFSQNNVLEMLEMDNLSGKITKYGTRELSYDTANRKMDSYTDFAKALVELFEEFEVSSNSNVILSLPNIYFGLMEVPQVLHGNNVTNVLLSEVEQSYIFKSNEPLVSWHNMTRGKKKSKDKPNTILYTAIQKDVVESILEVSQTVGCSFLTIESSHLSILRGLSFLGLISDQVRDNVIWQLMIVESNNFSIITMQGDMPIKYFEEPLALKSFEEDEIYKTIVASTKEVFENEKLKFQEVMIISKTDYVNAEALKMELDIAQPIDILNSNKYSEVALYPTSYEVEPEVAEQISLTAIGASAFLFYHYPIYLNYIKDSISERENIDNQIGNIKINLGNIELNITKNTIRRLSFILAGIMLIPLFLVYFILGQLILPQEVDKANNIQVNIEATNKQIKALTETSQQSKFDINTVAKKKVEGNKNLLLQYSVLGEVVPKNLWITHSEDNEEYFYLSGVALSTHTIYEFYKNLKAVMTNQELYLNELKVTNETMQDYIKRFGKLPKTMYSFVIASSKTTNKEERVKQKFSISKLDESNLFQEKEGIGRVSVSAEPPPKTEKAPETPSDNTSSNQRSYGLPINLKKIEDIGE